MENHQAGSSDSRELVVAALDHPSDLAALPGDTDEAIAKIDGWMVPLKIAEPKPGPGTHKLVGSLRTIGAKIAPTMSEEQVKVWIAAIVAALSDLPVRVSLRACEQAIHTPMKFLNEVETAIREHAEEVAARYRLAKIRLETRKRDLARSNQPQLPAPEPMSEDELQAMPEHLRRMGIGAGWIKEDADGRLSWTKEDQ